MLLTTVTIGLMYMYYLQRPVQSNYPIRSAVYLANHHWFDGVQYHIVSLFPYKMHNLTLTIHNHFLISKFPDGVYFLLYLSPGFKEYWVLLCYLVRRPLSIVVVLSNVFGLLHQDFWWIIDTYCLSGRYGLNSHYQSLKCQWLYH